MGSRSAHYASRRRTASVQRLASVMAGCSLLVPVRGGGYRGHMSDEAPSPPLRPASPDEVAESLSYALRYDGRRRVHHADTFMARITAERLIAHLERCGFVLMKKPERPAPTTSHHYHPNADKG